MHSFYPQLDRAKALYLHLYEKKGGRHMKKALSLFLDLFCAAALLISVWGLNYLLPQQGVKAQSIALSP